MLLIKVRERQGVNNMKNKLSSFIEMTVCGCGYEKIRSGLYTIDKSNCSILLFLNIKRPIVSANIGVSFPDICDLVNNIMKNIGFPEIRFPRKITPIFLSDINRLANKYGIDTNYPVMGISNVMDNSEIEQSLSSLIVDVTKKISESLDLLTVVNLSIELGGYSDYYKFMVCASAAKLNRYDIYKAFKEKYISEIMSNEDLNMYIQFSQEIESKFFPDKIL